MAAPTYICGFETGALVAEPGVAGAIVAVTGSVAIESTIVRTGTYSCKLTPASGANGFIQFQGGNSRSVRDRFYLRVTTLPATARLLYGITAAGEGSLVLNPNGSIELFLNTVSQGASTTLLTDTTRWYLIEVETGAAGSDLTLSVDGTVEATAVAAGAFVRLIVGAVDTVAATYTAYIEDVVRYANGVGSQPGAVALLRATSVNAANGWVEGDGAGTANMAAAVATRPPPGLASANETNATNIESATNSASDNCDMNMTTYAAAGIYPGDAIRGIQAFVRHGEDIATNTKAGAVTIVSNPAQTGEDSFNYGDDAGAHGAEVGFWRTKAGTIQTGSVTLTTAPVLRVGKRTATTRVVCVDFMGMYVDYLPGNRFPRALNVNQACKRACSY